MEPWSRAIERIVQNEGKATVVANRGTQHFHVGRRRPPEARDYEPAVVQLVRAQLGQNGGDLGGNAASHHLQITISGPSQEL